MWLVGGGLLSCLENQPNALSPCMVHAIQGPAIKLSPTHAIFVISVYRMSKNLKRKSGSSRRSAGRSKVQKLTYLSPESQSSTDDEWEPEILKKPRITDNDPSGSGKHFSIHLFLNLEDFFSWTEHAILEHSLNEGLHFQFTRLIQLSTFGKFCPCCYAYHSLLTSFVLAAMLTIL